MNIKASKDNGRALITIKGEISQWRRSEAEFTAAINRMIGEGVKDVHLYINSPGGDCFEANEIVNVIKRFSGKITGEGGAMVASAATYIAIHCDEFSMPENGLFMIHQPRGAAYGVASQIRSYLDLLEKMADNYYNAYLKKTTMKEEDFKSRWIAGDIWLNASEAKKYGFATAVNGKAGIDKATANMIKDAGYDGSVMITEESNINPINNSIMDIKSFLPQIGLDANTSEDVMVKTISDWKRKAERVDMLEKKEEDRLNKEIDALIDKAILDKRITAEAKEDWKETLNANFEAGKRMIESLTPVVKPKVNTPVSGIEGKTFEQLQDEDPEALAEIAKNDPERYDKLFKDYMKKNKV